MAALPPPPPGPGGPPMGGPPMGGPPMGGPEEVSPEQVDQLISMLLTLPPEILQQIISAIDTEMAAGGEEMSAPGPAEADIPAGALDEAAQARAGL